MADPPEFRCEVCGFALGNRIAALSVGTLGLYDDARFPGRCVLVLRRHAEHLEELDADTASRLLRDIQTAGAAIRRVTGAKRMNYALLGNVVPHLHAHLIPRGGTADPDPGRSPWEIDRPETPLAPAEAERLRRAIGEALR